MKTFLKQQNSIKWFYIVCGAIFIVSGLNGIINQRIINVIATVIVFVLFCIYSIVRFNHYRLYYPYEKSYKYLLLDNIPLLLGIVYLVLMDIYINKKEEVNFVFLLSLVPFVIPTGIGNTRLSNNSGKSE